MGADSTTALIADATRRHLDAMIASGTVLVDDDIDVNAVGRQAAEFAARGLRRPRQSALARRIGPVYSLAHLREWLTPPDAPPLTAEAVRKRAVKHTLIAFQTDDRQWAFPAYQFVDVAGHLIPRDDVIAVWQALPHDSWRSDATLAAWMTTRLASMDGHGPAEFAGRHGADHPLVADAIRRLALGQAA